MKLECGPMPNVMASLLNIGGQMAIFWQFLRAVFSASHTQHVSDLHCKFTLRPHHVW